MTTAGSLGDQLKCDNQPINQINHSVQGSLGKVEVRGMIKNKGKIALKTEIRRERASEDVRGDEKGGRE